MFGQADLTFRQFERNDVLFEGEFEVDAAYQGQVVFSGRHSATVDLRTLHIAVSDISAGGIGFQAPIFLPRMLTGIVRIFDLHEPSSASEAGAINCIAFEHAVRIRRCELTSRVPSYFVGSSFENADERLDTALAALMVRIRSSMRRLLKPTDEREATGREQSGA